MTSGPTSPFPVGTLAVRVPQNHSATFRAMATDVRLQVVDGGHRTPAAMAAAEQVFRDVEAACTRFDPESPLMLANGSPDAWHEVPAVLLAAIREAYEAYVDTAGLFDPRVLKALTSLGYDRTLPFESQAVELVGAEPGDADRPSAGVGRRPDWEPSFDVRRSAVRIGLEPIDLGGIGKGLAVRWAADALREAGRGLLVEAGGDCAMGGDGPDGDRWLVGVEDPNGGTDPVAVLSVRDLACTTSSTRVRRWWSGGREVHHLIDPRTLEPGGHGLRSVTVVQSDPARAEVWSKALFLQGEDGIAEAAAQRGLVALWVDDAGTLGNTAVAEPYIVWRAAA